MCHYAQLIFIFLVESGFHHVGQAGLELLTCDPPTSASQSAGITGVSHCTQPIVTVLCAFTGGAGLMAEVPISEAILTMVKLSWSLSLLAVVSLPGK